MSALKEKGIQSNSLKTKNCDSTQRLPLWWPNMRNGGCGPSERTHVRQVGHDTVEDRDGGGGVVGGCDRKGSSVFGGPS